MTPVWHRQYRSLARVETQNWVESWKADLLNIAYIVTGLNVLYRYFPQPFKITLIFYLLPVAMPQLIHLLWTRATGVTEGMWHNNALPASVNFCLVTSICLFSECWILDALTIIHKSHLGRENCIALLCTQYWNLKTKMYRCCLINLYFLPALGKRAAKNNTEKL